MLAFVSGSFFLLPGGSDAADSSNTVDITVNPVLSMTASPTVDMTITPTPSGNTTTEDITVSVATNNATGYTLTMNATAATNVDLIHSNGTNKIMNSTNTTASTLTANTWGYNKNTGTTPTTFFQIPALTTPAAITATTAPSTDTNTVTIGANANTSIPSGYYTSQLTFTAVGNYVPPAPLVLPIGVNPSNISATNPAVMDVYPTIGWTGDVVAITSNALFTNVESVTIGGTACTVYNVVNTSLIACKLPAKTAGTTNDITVTNSGTNVTNAATYTHMKITYFNPSTATVNIGGTTYNFYPNGFTSANCSAMTANNSAIGSTPNTSLAYVRDTRNNQTYKVKKMADNKCWMVDNLKYIDSNMTNTADNTTGMTYNNGDHIGNGGTTAQNTVDESGTLGTANSDKAFFNNPMSTANCYGSTYMPSGTLTHCGYLYNWYAATAGTGTYSQATQGNQATGNICPANFRLPSGLSDGSTPTGNGTSVTAADLPVLNASMNAGTLTTGNTSISYYAGWQPSGAWGGAFSGYWSTGFYGQGSDSYFWSSTVDSVAYARYLYFYASGVLSGNGVYNKYVGFAVRCLIP